MRAKYYHRIIAAMARGSPASGVVYKTVVVGGGVWQRSGDDALVARGHSVIPCLPHSTRIATIGL